MVALHEQVLSLLGKNPPLQIMDVLLRVLPAMMDCTPYARLQTPNDLRLIILQCLDAVHYHKCRRLTSSVLLDEASSVECLLFDCYVHLLDTIDSNPAVVCTFEHSCLALLQAAQSLVSHQHEREAGSQLKAKISALDVICAIARNLPKVIKMQWWNVFEGVSNALDAPEDAIRLAGIKVLEQATHSWVTAIDQTPQDAWATIIPLVLKCSDSTQFYAVRSMAATLMGHIPESEAALLSDEMANSFRTTLQKLIVDDHPEVRSSSWATFGILVNYERLGYGNQDMMEYIMHQILTSLKQESTLTVRVRAGWTLGNVADRIQKHTLWHKLGISDGIWLELLQIAFDLASGHEKSRSNGVRAIGNLVLLISHEPFCSSIPFSSLEEPILCVIKASKSGNFKVSVRTIFSNS